LTNRFQTDAVQFIKFFLNEEGAVLRSEAAIHCLRCLSFNVNRPRRMIFDGPFLIYIKEKPDYPPYFAAWITNTDYMEKIK
jgi:hypothetical protein